MAKFIEVHKGGTPVLINLDKVEAVCGNDEKRTVLRIHGNNQHIDETYDEVRLMIGSAQGGIPLDSGGSY